MDKILLRNLEYLCCIGVTEAERGVPQRISVDADVSLNLQKAAVTDEIGNTVCWDRLNRIFSGCVEGPPCLLAESLAERMATAAFAAFPQIREIRLCLKKYCLPNAAWVGVEIRRSAAE
jgi:dihydroneopterin aldolase